MSVPARRDVARAGVFLALFLAALLGSLSALVSISAPPSDARATAHHFARGEEFESSGRIEDAMSEYAAALDRARDRDDAEYIARAANALANLNQQVGEPGRALELASEALAASERAARPAHQSEAHFNLGAARYSMGRARTALRSFQLSAEVAARHGLARLEARALLQAGLTATLLDRRDAAGRMLARARAVSRRLRDASGEAAAVRALGQLSSRVGDSQEALDRFAEARALLTPLGDPASDATLLNATGQVYLDLGMADVALQSFEEALRLNRSLRYKRREAATLLEIGRSHLALGEVEEASKSFGEALRIYRELENPRLEADVLSEIARLSERSGGLEGALRHLEEAIQLKRTAGDARYLAYALTEAARLQVDLGELEAAGRRLEESLDLTRAVQDPWGESLAWYQSARLRRSEGRLADAVIEIERSLAIVEGLRARVASHALRASFLSSVHEQYFLLVSVLADLHERHPGAGYDGRAFEASERARARTLVDSLEETGAGVGADVAPELVEERRALRDRLSEAAREQQLLPPGTLEYDQLGRELDGLAAEYDRVEARMRSASPRYAALTRPEPASLDEVQSELLPEGTTLLAYALGADRSFLWSVTREERRLVELPPGSQIEALAARVHRGLASPRGGGTLDADLARLRDLLFGPVPHVGERARLIVVTEGALNYVPFGVLPLPSGEPLVTATEVVRLPSMSVLPLLRRQRPEREPPRWALVVADPVYGAADARTGADRGARDPLEWSRLSWSGQEAQAIAATAPEAVELLTGLDAHRERLMETGLRDFRILHFATHGVIDARRPELSGVVLSLVDEAGRPREGFLRLHDIYELDLAAELVVLSACETALGAEVRGEGIVGLVRGFMYAGAASVVASAWRVDDEATSELMRLFYERLHAGAPKAGALREAQVELRRAGRWRAPYYWAAFELQGDWR